MAKNFLSKGEYEKAARFFDKSLRLFPLPGVKALKEKAEKLARGETESTHSHHESGSSGGSSHHRKHHHSNHHKHEEK